MTENTTAITVTVLRNVQDQKGVHGPGAELELSEVDAESLIALGAVERKAAKAEKAAASGKGDEGKKSK